VRGDREVRELALRTAEAHVAAAEDHARKIREDARSRAEKIRQEARLYAEQIRTAAEDALAEAQATAVRSRGDAISEAAGIRHRAERELAEARREAERIRAGARDRCEQLKLQARQRYEDAVANLPIKRLALEKQIEALELFDLDYRQELTGSVQRQMRTLWADQVEVSDVPAREVSFPDLVMMLTRP
jgi:hypothetical protein